VTALVVGAVLVVAALLVVILPLLTPGYRRTHPMLSAQESPDADAVSAIDALREIEFDRATGKLSDADYAELRATYAPRALADIRQSEARSAPQCATCQAIISDPDARFCARCGLPFAA
jgi:cytochrome c-type biogenesis protein CcmI